MSDQIAEQLTHPSAAELSAFSLGQLLPGDAQEVESHISHCQPCCDTLLELSSDDTFVALLQEVDRAPADATVDLDSSRVGASRSDVAEVPAALADHPRYHVLGLVGRGGMGDVYAAEHRMMERKVALKVINRDLVSRPEAVERFHREVRAAARLHHPNIVAAYDAEQAGDTHFLAMEFVDGTELSEIVRQEGPLPASVACDYARQVAAGLAHAHELGMVHRDIKPQNLMLDSADRIKILDFGLASFATEAVANAANESTSELASPAAVQLTQHGTMMGTPDYIAPEQAADARSADIRSDIYSLGCTLYYLLTGRPPFAGESVLEKVRSHTERTADSLCAVRDDLPTELDEVVRRMMAKNPGDRFQDPQEVVEALSLRAVSAVAQTAAGPLASSADSGFRLPRWLIAAAMLPIVFAAGLFLYLATDTGKIEIRSDVEIPGAKVVLTKDGQEYASFDLEASTTVQSIRAGEYQIEIVGVSDDPDVNVRTRQADANEWRSPDNPAAFPMLMYRGGTMIVTVSKNHATNGVGGTGDSLQSDFNRLQGEWIAESGERNGKSTPVDEVGIQRAVFDGENIRIEMPHGIDGAGTFQLQANAQPKVMGLFVTGEFKGARAIYQLQDNRLMLCINLDPSGELPKSFEAPAGSSFDLVVLRQKGTLSQRTTSDGMYVKTFDPTDPTIAQDNITTEDGAWKITAEAPRTVRLFEVPNPEVGPGVFFYHAYLKTEKVKERVYLEMWVRLPGKGEFFSKGFHNAVSGSNGWAEVTIPFRLEEGQQPDLVKLNLAIEGTGTVWIKDVEIRGPAMVEKTVPRANSAVPQLLQQFSDLIDAARQATTDQEWAVVMNEYASAMAGEDVETERFGKEEIAKMRQAERRSVELLSELPDEAHDQLLDAGYLKWRFKELDEQRQQAVKNTLSDMLDASAKMGFPKELKESLFQLLATGDVGFAIVNGPDGQSLVWYFAAPGAPMPIMLPILTSGDEEGTPFTKSVFKQLGELEDMPHTALPSASAGTVK